MLTTLFAFVAQPAAAVVVGTDPEGDLLGFEIEGDQIDNPAAGFPGIDWNTVTTEIVVTDDTADSGLVGTSKENDPSDFVCNTGGANPGKANILAAAVNARFSAAAAILDLAYSRQEGQGDTHVNFEFNQGTTTYDCANSNFVGRQNDDILLVFDFPGGSDAPNIEGFRWVTDDPADTDPVCNASFLPAGCDDGAWITIANFPPGAAAGSSNAASIANPLFGTPATLDARTFGEVTLDLAAIFPDLFNGPCRHFGTLNVRSRSSGESFNSALQDRLAPTPVDLSTCGQVTIHKQDDAGNPLPGATFGLFATEALAQTRLAGNAVKTCVSQANGNCVFTDVSPGSYFIAEISAPDGYDIDPDIVPVTVAARQIVDVAAPFVDPRDTGFVTITKAITGVPNAPISTLAGATFELRQGGVVASLWPTPPSNDPATCTIQAGQSSCTIGPVPLGTYDVVETVAPPGTTIGPAIPAVTIDEDGETVQVTYSNPPNPININLDKSGPDVADIGSTFTYTFAVTNTGTLRLGNVSVVELAPFDDRCNASPISGPVKTGGNQDDFLDPGGETWTYSCQHLVTPADGTSLHNVARASGTDQFGRTVTDDDPHDVIIRYPDLNVVKDGNGTVNAGGTATFTITVTNQGTGPALNSTLTDTLPAGSWTLGGTDSAVCSIGGGNVLSCNFGTIAAAPADNIRQITLSRTVTVADCGAINNTATVSTVYNPGGIDIDTDGTDNSDSGTVNVTCPDVGVSKTGNGTISAGDVAQFTIVVQNFGTGEATGVTLSDPLPSGVDWALSSDTGDPDCTIIGAVGSETLSCAPFSLGAGASRTIVVQGVTDQADCGTLPNTVTITPGNGDTNPNNNTSSATITVQCPDIDVVKTADAEEVNAGEAVGFGITVDNGGPGNAYDVTLNDPLPAGLDWAIDSVTGDVIPNCQITGAVGSEVLSCAGVTLASGQSYSVHVTAQTSFDACATYDNTATADASNDDPEDDSARIVCLAPDLDIVKTADDTIVSAGEEIGFSITVENLGPGVAFSVDLTDTLPAGPVWVLDEAGSADHCSLAGNALECGPVDMEAGDSFTVHVTAATSAEECGSYDNTAFAEGSNHPEVDSSASIDCLVPGLNVLKDADDEVVEAGDAIGFTVDVFNFDDPEVDTDGGIAFDVALNDPLPAGVDWSLDGVTGNVDPANPTCQITGAVGSEVLTCNAVDLDPGEGYEVHVVAETAAGACAVYDNTATATQANGPGDSDDASIGCLDIELDKGGPALAHVGDTVTYTFDVTNTGGVDLVEVTLTDPDCDTAPVLVAGDGAVLSPGETWGYTCTRVIEATDPDPVPNLGTVVGEDEGGNTTSDTDPHSVDLIHPAIQVVKTVDDATPDVGQTVTFTYVVTNTGDTTLFNVTVVDDKLGAIGTIPELAAGASAQLTKTMVVAANSPTTNIATATGTDVLGKSVTDDDPETIAITEVLPVVITPAPLPRTGDEHRRLLVVAGVLMILGGALVGGGRRRPVGLGW